MVDKKMTIPQQRMLLKVKDSIKKYEIDETGLMYLYIKEKYPSAVVWRDGRVYKYMH